MASATTPTLSPSSLSVYDDSRRPNGRTPSDARRLLTPAILVEAGQGRRTARRFRAIRRQLRRGAPRGPVAGLERAVKSEPCPADKNRVVTNRQGLILAAQAVVLILAMTAAIVANQAADWDPIELVLLLFVLAVGSDMLTVEVRSVRVSGAFLALVLAMALLGPAPAAVKIGR